MLQSGHPCRAAGGRQARSWRPFTTTRPVRSVAARAQAPTQPQQAAASSEGLVFPCGTNGSWDEAGVGSPVVRCFVGDNEERWLMWYSGRSAGAPELDAVAPSSGHIGVARSDDGIHWYRGEGNVEGSRDEDAYTDMGVVLEPNKDWWWFDTCHMHAGDVQVLSNNSVNSGVGVFWMFYSGGDYEPLAPPKGVPGMEGQETIEGLRMRPGLAMSQDGRNWARIEGDHHSGALIDVGAVGEWDHLFIAGPQVVAAGPRDMRLYYHSYDADKGRFVVGLATSPDGFRWTKKGPCFDPGAAAPAGAHDAKGATFRHVVRDVDNKQFLMFYEAVAADGSRSIGMAASPTGLADWQRCPTPVLRPSGEEGAWDGGAVGSPNAVAMAAGKWRLYYGGRPQKDAGPWTGIGLALSADGAAAFQKAPAEFVRRAPKPAS